MRKKKTHLNGKEKIKKEKSPQTTSGNYVALQIHCGLLYKRKSKYPLYPFENSGNGLYAQLSRNNIERVLGAITINLYGSFCAKPECFWISPHSEKPSTFHLASSSFFNLHFTCREGFTFLRLENLARRHSECLVSTSVRVVMFCSAFFCFVFVSAPAEMLGVDPSAVHLCRVKQSSCCVLKELTSASLLADY